MKRFLLYLLAIVTLVACTKSDDGGDPNPDPTPSKPKTEIKIETTESDFSSEGGRQAISFTTTEAWTAEVINSRADGWCSISPTSGAAGSATISVTTEPNDTPDDRSASIVIRAGSASKTVKVSQKQKDALTVTASTFEVEAEGGEVKIEVKANIDFEYAIDESAQEWIKYEGTRAMKTSTLTFSVAENDDTEKREGKIAIKSGEFNEVVTIYQAGGKPSIVISQNEYVVSSDGETISVEVSSNVDVAVEMPADADWISENTTRATSTNTYRFDIQPNEDYDQRSAEIKFTNKENNLSEVVAIKQMQRDAIVLADSEYEFGIDGGNLDFEIQTNVDITVTISEDAIDWIQQVETRALETQALYFNVAACSAEEDREGTITISGGNATQTITVKQCGLKEILEKEREALIAFYNATGGDNWTNNGNWCSDKPVSEWYGVYTYDVEDGEYYYMGQRVATISLGSNNLTGSINKELDVFSELRVLDIPGNNISGSLVLQNEKLRHLGCSRNQLSSINVSGLVNLKGFDCSLNYSLTSLVGLDSPVLTYLWCEDNNLSSLDVSKLYSLESLMCRDNPITELNLSNNPVLTQIWAYNTSIETLDFSNNPMLVEVSCGENNTLRSIDVSKNTNLEVLHCRLSKSIGSIDVSNCPKLKTLLVDCNNLSTLDISKNPELETLFCSGNNLSKLDFSNNPKLKMVFCGNPEYYEKSTGNHLTDIDISKNTELETFSCYGMNITSIDISNNHKLIGFECTENPITDIDFSNNPNLTGVYIYNTNISSVDISNLRKLESLECSLCPIDSLNFSNNPALTGIYAHHTNIKTINVGKNPNLTFLECGYNDINKIDVSKNYNLEWLYCSGTQQKTLDVSYNPYLKGLTTVESPNLETIYITDYQNFQYLKDDHTKFIYKDGGDNPFELYESTDYSKDGEVKQLQTATKGNGIDIVLMGDAYSDRLIADGTYDDVMNTAMEKFFMEEPYKSYRDHFNVYSVKAVSKNEGYDTGIEETCFAVWAGDGSLVGGNDSRVFSYAEKAIGAERMDDALIIVMMNSSKYAGTCYMYSPTDNDDWGDGVSISYFPVGVDDTALAQVLHHEAGGHGFSKLADEYAYVELGAIPDSEISSRKSYEPYGWYKNVDFTNDPTKVKWSTFLSDARYANDGLGVYEGAFTYWTGAYRPSWNSIMNTNTGGFNAPSREAIYYRIHKLAYGAEWEYDYEKFVEYDAINRKTAATTRGVPYRLDIPEDFKPLHPPVVMNTSWRNAKNNAPAKKTIVPSGNTGNAGRNLQKVSTPSVGTTARKTMKASTSITSANGRTVTVTTDLSSVTETTYSK